MSEAILNIEGLSKTFRTKWFYRPVEAVRNLSLEIRRGEAFGFIGHNGAGKTTTIKSILGLVRKTKGRILFQGKDLSSAAQRAFLGYLPEQPYFYDHLTVRETLEFFAGLHSMSGKERCERIDELIRLVGLSDVSKRPVRLISKGQQQRLGFAQAVLNRPTLLLLDEPFSGLDPGGRIEIRQLISELRADGTTIFLSSHILGDVEEICDRVGIISRGVLEKVFGLNEVPGLFGERFELVVRDLDASTGIAEHLKAVCQDWQSRTTSTGVSSVFFFDEYSAASNATAAAISTGLVVESFRRVGKTLEEIFVGITNSADSSSEV